MPGLGKSGTSRMSFLSESAPIVGACDMMTGSFLQKMFSRSEAWRLRPLNELTKFLQCETTSDRWSVRLLRLRRDRHGRLAVLVEARHRANRAGPLCQQRGPRHNRLRDSAP